MTNPQTTGVRVREMRPDDLAAVAAIYNEAIERLESTREVEPQTPERCGEWILSGDDRYLGWVGDVGGELAGWASLTRFYGRPAYNWTAEVSVYVAARHRRSGVGRALAENVLERARALDFHCLVLFLFPEQAWLRERAARYGFVDCGGFPQAGRWGGEVRDVAMLQLLLPGGPGAA